MEENSSLVAIVALWWRVVGSVVEERCTEICLLWDGRRAKRRLLFISPPVMIREYKHTTSAHVYTGLQGVRRLFGLGWRVRSTLPGSRGKDRAWAVDLLLRPLLVLLLRVHLRAKLDALE